MDIKIDSLIPFDSLKTNIGHVFSVVEKNGKAVLLKDNKPAYWSDRGTPDTQKLPFYFIVLINGN